MATIDQALNIASMTDTTVEQLYQMLKANRRVHCGKPQFLYLDSGIEAQLGAAQSAVRSYRKALTERMDPS